MISTDQEEIGTILKSIPSRNPESKKGVLTLCDNLYTYWENGWNWNHNHLFLVSDNAIEEGAFVYNSVYNKISKVASFGKHAKTFVKLDVDDHSPDWSNLFNLSTVIASTDKSLNLPNIPEEFIRLYIEKYNSGHPIEEVEVEYDINGLLGGPVDKYRKDGYFVNRKDNTICISIQSTKDSYTRKEVEVLMRKTWRIACSDTDKALLPELEDKFIEENL